MRCHEESSRYHFWKLIATLFATPARIYVPWCCDFGERLNERTVCDFDIRCSVCGAISHDCTKLFVAWSQFARRCDSVDQDPLTVEGIICGGSFKRLGALVRWSPSCWPDREASCHRKSTRAKVFCQSLQEQFEVDWFGQVIRHACHEPLFVIALHRSC